MDHWELTERPDQNSEIRHWREGVDHLFGTSIHMAYRKVTQTLGREEEVAVIKGRRMHCRN